jgi:signal peptidase I
MADTFKNNDILLVNVQDEEIKRYDVVVAKESGTRIIKRVIALPSETVQIVDGIIYVNGEEIAKYNSGTDRAGIAESCYQLGEAEYFLMGDNRSGSMDSRDFGAVKKENINGVVIYQLYPFSDMRSVPHGEEERN